MKVLFTVGLLTLLCGTAVFAQSESDTTEHHHHHHRHHGRHDEHGHEDRNEHRHHKVKTGLIIGVGVGSGTFDRFNKLFNNTNVPTIIGNKLGIDFTLGIERRVRRLEFGLISNAVYSKNQDNGNFGVTSTLGGLHFNVGYNVIPRDYRVKVIPFVGIGVMMAKVAITKNGGLDYSQIQSAGLQSASVTLRNYSANVGLAVRFKMLGIRWRLQNGIQFGLPSNHLSTDGNRISGAPKLGFNSMYSALCFDF